MILVKYQTSNMRKRKMTVRILAIVVLMGMLFSQVFPQEAEVKINNIKTTGIGFEFQTIGPLVAALTNSSSASGSLFLPMVTEKFMIEPNISFMYDSDELDYDNPDYDDQEDYESYLMINVGLFFVNHKSEKLRTYTGARVGMATSKSKSAYSENEIKGKAFLFGPAMGAEYFISEHLSFGGECTLRIGRGTEEGSNYYDEEYTETETTTLLVPTLMIRFYF